ncbi:hypothetical protein [Curtobacterium poinsettiae]|uniref:hypothetical protein n=1 Tax=Curtobacterium TaxID=2034 RepID=UPI00217EE211|nr:hypothetical protein [Curtobacterium flaccumfaciens]MCS6563426.1 hypothetical protein [Curtobacterium flaccumfaciens pv. poinsettiae]UXN30310.1 hypothetical protein N8D75_08775 [Curtobacterium flaccumfaciens]
MTDTKPDRTMWVVGAVLAAVVVVLLIVGGIVTAVQRQTDQDRIDRMVNDRVTDCLIWDHC